LWSRPQAGQIKVVSNNQGKNAIKIVTSLLRKLIPIWLRIAALRNKSVLHSLSAHTIWPCMFLVKNIGKKAACKMLVELTKAIPSTEITMCHAKINQAKPFSNRKTNACLT
jgi:hypothetical protein